MDIAVKSDILRPLIGTLGFWAIINYIAYQQGYYAFPKESKARPIVEVSFKETFGAFLSFITAQVVIVPIGIFALMFLNYGITFPKIDDLSLPLKVWINVLSIISGGVFILIYAFAVKKESFWLLFGKKTSALYNFLFGMLSWIVCYPGFFLLSMVLSFLLKDIFGIQSSEEQLAIKHLKSTFEYPLPFILTIIALITVVPVTEELLFRGFLQNALRKKFGIGVSIAIASLVFAFFHFSFSQGIYNLELIPLLFYLSCYLGYCYEKQKSLWAPIGLHALFNLFNVIFIIHSTLLKGI